MSMDSIFCKKFQLLAVKNEILKTMYFFNIKIAIKTCRFLYFENLQTSLEERLYSTCNSKFQKIINLYFYVDSLPHKRL